MIGVLTTLLFGLVVLLIPLLKDAIQTIGNYAEYGVLGSVVLALLGSIAYAWVWHRQERAGTAQSGLRHAWLQAIIRYWLAFSISGYGFAKIFRTQFETPSYRLDMPVSELNGFALTWYYFGYSYALAVIIALFQIGGSVLLLYRRTTLLGVMILLPVLVNIVLINVFFSIDAEAFFNSVVFTLALLFFLFLDLDKLKRVFWDLVDRLPPLAPGRSALKHGLRLLPVAGAFATTLYLMSVVTHDKVLAGTWKVEQFSRNGQPLPANAWLTDTTAWNRVYFAGWQGCAFSPNPYRYRPNESLRGDYEFDSLKNSLRIVVRNPKTMKTKTDTLRATLSNRTAKTMRFRGILRGDTLDMQLARLR